MVTKSERWLRAGVYVLWGAATGDQLPSVYVGQSGNLKERLPNHVSTKAWWTHCIVFSSNRNLNQSQCRYIEARMWQLAKAAKRCELRNSQTPSLPSFARADKVDADMFLSDMILCLKVLGVTYFDTPQPSGEAEEFVLESKGIMARGYEDAQGFVVLADSRAVKEETSSLGAGSRGRRKALLKGEVIEDCGDNYRLVQNYVFDSPSMAASVLLARSANGLNEWKAEDGRTLGEVRKQAETA